MITIETITEKIQRLPAKSQKEVSDFVNELLKTNAKTNPSQKADSWEKWANSHNQDTVILDDSREAIYEDE